VAFEKNSFSFPAVCQQCSVAACMAVCPVGAISKDENGAMKVNHSICLRCKMCTIACPFGATFYDAENDNILKCDLCGGDPQCVKYCTAGAITYREANTVNLNKRRSTAEKFMGLAEEGR